MKYKKKLLTSIMLLGLSVLTSLQAQEAIHTAGGEASGSGGSSSYTIGQMVYTTETGTNGNSVAQGMQQPFEISVVTGIPEAKGINLTVSAYPNPTTDYLILKIGNDVETNGRSSEKNILYQLFDINGKMINTKKVIKGETKIKTDNLKQGSYLLRIIENNKEIKVFKIIKK